MEIIGVLNDTDLNKPISKRKFRINIINQFKEQVPRQNGLMNYFVEKRLKDLMEHIEDF